MLFKKKPTLFTPQEEVDIVKAIRMAEHKTSGEIRVHVDRSLKKGEALDRAQVIFKKLGMHKTEHLNGILFYVAQDQQKIAIWGDEGIHDCVKEYFWDQLVDEMKLHFAAGNYSKGLIEAINKTGDKLKDYFPYNENDKNELSDEISY